tara:strand:+ start:467 stop:883 length:417 start_codon:yes stop_codon:yes gene_type:complete
MSNVVSISGLIITALAFIFTVISFKRQLRLSFFSEYTKRYQEIIINLPSTINSKEFDFDHLDEEEKDKTLRYMRAYFDLCSEEYFLMKRGHIGEETWQEWSAGMEFSFSKVAFKKAWFLLREDTIYYGEFCQFVEQGM